MSENKENTMNETEKQKILEDSGVINFKDRLYLAQEGLSGNAFAKKVSMSEAVIRDYLSGRTYPSLNRLAFIANKCNISLEWLATGNGECRLSPTKESEKTIYIPVYQTSQLNSRIEKSSNTAMNKLPFDFNWVTEHKINPEDLFVYWAKGDSMNPTISDNDALIINTANTCAFDGYIYVIQYGDALNVKRIQNHGKCFLLLSDNEKYPAIEIDKAGNDNDFKIIGRVIYIIKDLS